MSSQHMFWFCIITSVSSVLEMPATVMAHEENETYFNLQGEVKLLSTITTSEPQLVSSDIGSEAQDEVSLDVDVNEETSLESKAISSNSLPRNSYPLGEFSMSLEDYSEHGVKNNSSGSVISINNDEAPLQGKVGSTIVFGSSTHADDISNYYYEDEYVAGNESEEESAKKEATGNEEVSNNEEFLTNSETDRVPLSETPSQENTAVAHTTDSSAQSTPLNDGIQDRSDIAARSTTMTIQSEPDHPAQHSASEYTTAIYTKDMTYTDEILSDSIKTAYTESSTTATVTDRIKNLSFTELWEGIHHEITSDKTAEIYLTLKQTPRSGREPSRSQHQVQNDYADDYYEMWGQNRGQSTTMSLTVSDEINTANDNNQGAYVPHSPTWQDEEHTVGTDTFKDFYTSDKVTIATVNHDSTVSEESERVTTATWQSLVSVQDVSYFSTGQDSERTVTTETDKNFHASDEVTIAAVEPHSSVREEGVRATNVPYFLTGQAAEHTFGTETFKHFYTSAEITDAAVDHASTILRENVRATTGVRKPQVSMQHDTTSEDIPQTRDLEYVDIMNNNAMLRHWEEKYKSVATTNNGRSAVSEPPLPSYGTTKRTSYAMTNKFNYSTNKFKASTGPKNLAPFKEYRKESTRSMRNFESASEVDSRAQRESLRKVFTISDDFAACKECDAEATDTTTDHEQENVLQLQTNQNRESNISNIPENYDMCEDCVQEDTDMTIFNNVVRIAPETQKQQTESKSKDEEKMANEAIQRKMQSYMGRIPSRESNRAVIKEVSFSDYPWFVIVEASNKEMRCGGAMVAPRWLLTASACLRSDDTRTDAHSVPVEVTVNVTGKLYRTVRAVFAPGAGVALARLSDPPESTLRLAGTLDLAEYSPLGLWSHCVVLGMGRSQLKTLVCPENIYAVGVKAWMAAEPLTRSQRDASWRLGPSRVHAVCSADPGAPLVCNRHFITAATSPPSTSTEKTTQLPMNEPAQLVLVGVSAAQNKPGLACRRTFSEYWSVAAIHIWVEHAIAYTNNELERISGRQMVLPPDPYSQRLQRLRAEDSLPKPRDSGGTTSSRGHLLRLLTAVACRILLGS